MSPAPAWPKWSLGFVRLKPRRSRTYSKRSVRAEREEFGAAGQIVSIRKRMSRRLREVAANMFLHEALGPHASEPTFVGQFDEVRWYSNRGPRPRWLQRSRAQSRTRIDHVGERRHVRHIEHFVDCRAARFRRAWRSDHRWVYGA